MNEIWICLETLDNPLEPSYKPYNLGFWWTNEVQMWLILEKRFKSRRCHFWINKNSQSRKMTWYTFFCRWFRPILPRVTWFKIPQQVRFILDSYLGCTVEKLGDCYWSRDHQRLLTRFWTSVSFSFQMYQTQLI